MVMKRDLHMSAFSNGRLTIARDLIGVMISFSSLSLSFSLLRSRSPPSRVDVYLKPCPH